MASNNEYEHRSEWDRKVDRLLCDVIKDRKMAKNIGISGTFGIVDGELVIGGMLRDGVEVVADFEKLMILDRVVRAKIEGYEKEFQRGFVPDVNTRYVLPPEEDFNK